MQHLKKTDLASYVKPSRAEAEEAIRTLLAYAGEDLTREGVRDTPRRVIKAYEEYYSGYKDDPRDFLQKTFSEVSGYSDVVLLRDIPFYSHCEHHMAPIEGVAHIAYWPNKKIVGISKLARVVDAFARRLQIQENMTAEIATVIQDVLQPHGAAVSISAAHHCMIGRGVNKTGTILVTSHFTGIYETDYVARADVKSLMRA
jgi:GTP cyclohydrolase I